ncbi:hypothetical protein SAMN05421741_10413 [Paenimyroides ummariense]|uniref:40-residue YVTN family beta-propeller repeat-containing protein n=1 Tax=Paenimyroides ummariense TaxID=913024 RepID=A0A1I4Y4J2_9FLAO|nr:DUF5074 domain-containing protein [Paenimyroides ummariense]SFN33011.1 hypothetical protein SAMN05421741_10413 [Paenimyroides ummariense]
MKKILAPMFAVTLLYSCSNSDDNTVPVNPDEKYLDGIFVSNEGNFTKGNASTSYINNGLTTITNDIFTTTNGRALGDVSQSMVVTDKYVYIVVNNSNTIEVVNKKTFKSVYTITQGLSSPRYAVVKNNKLYVTSLNKASVNVYNAETFAFIKEIELNHTSENIVVVGDYIYTANGFYSGGMAIEVINPANDTNTVDIAFDKAISGISTNGQFVYALSANATTTSVSVVNNTSITATKVLDQPIARNIVAEGSNLYYTAGTGVYKMSNSLTAAGTKLFDVAQGADFSVFYGFNVINGTIFTSDANGFVDNSKIVIYKEDGSVVKEFAGGIGTNGFYKF